MAEAFVELGAEGLNHIVDGHWDSIHDNTRKILTGKGPTPAPQAQQVPAPASQAGSQYTRAHRYESKRDGRPRKYRNDLPSPERDYDSRGEGRQQRRRSDSLERESLTSERVTAAYENERDDPIRPIDPKIDRKLRRDSGRMSYAGGLGAGDGYRQDRAHSAQPPRSRYYDDDDQSDYDERTGKRYSGGGRGYDDRHDDDRGYDREVITEERYRGPARGLPYDNRRNDSYQSRDPYGPGAVATYRRSQGDLTEASKRSRSRGRRDKYYDDRDRSYSRSRSNSRDRERGGRGGEEGWRGKLDDTFDTSTRGLGVGIAGAVIGGLAGRQFGHKHKERDILVGAVLGGLASNIAENKYSEWKDKKEGKLDQREERWEQKWDEGSRTGKYK